MISGVSGGTIDEVKRCDFDLELRGEIDRGREGSG
jgi:hypothetical protein